jgi:hypothetical protein
MWPNWSERKMDVSSVGGLSSALSQMQTGDTVGMVVLKKAIDIQAQSALQLLQALPQVPSNPPNLGNVVDVKA